MRKIYTVIFYKVVSELRISVEAESRVDAGKAAKSVFDQVKSPNWRETDVQTLHRIIELADEEAA